MVDKFEILTNNNGDLSAVDRDTLLTDVTLYWVRGTMGSAIRSTVKIDFRERN